MAPEFHITRQTVLQDIRNLIRYHETLGIREYALTPSLKKFLSAKEPAAPAESARPVTETLADIRAAMEGCDHCSLHRHRGRMIFGQGTEKAALMIVTDWPTPEDEQSGKPFSGAAGDLLDKMLAAIDLSRKQVYLTGLVKCKPAVDKPPGPDEISACLPFLKRQAETVSPKVICAMGAHAAQYLLQTDEPLIRLRGRFHSCRLGDGRSVRLMPTFHPAYLLQNQEMKRPCWQDLLMIQNLLRKRS